MSNNPSMTPPLSSPVSANEQGGAAYAGAPSVPQIQDTGPTDLYQILSSGVGQVTAHQPAPPRIPPAGPHGLPVVLPPENLKRNLPPGALFDHSFEQKLYNDGMYSCGQALPGQTAPLPNNWRELTAALTEKDSSVYQVKQSTFKEWKRLSDNAQEFLPIVDYMLELLHGNENIDNRIGVNFNNMVPLLESPLVHINPDFYDGADSSQLNERIQERWQHCLFPTEDRKAPGAPNFFLEAKHSDFPVGAARRLALCDGAAGARAMLALQTAERPVPLFDCNAYTITSTLVDGVLKVYAVHPRPTCNPLHCAGYYMTELGGWYLFGSLGQFRRGLSAFRNLRAWAKTKRDILIRQANVRFFLNRTGSISQNSVLPSVEGSPVGSDNASPQGSPRYCPSEVLDGSGDSKPSPQTKACLACKPSSKESGDDAVLSDYEQINCTLSSESPWKPTGKRKLFLLSSSSNTSCSEADKTAGSREGSVSLRKRSRPSLAKPRTHMYQ